MHGNVLTHKLLFLDFFLYIHIAVSLIILSNDAQCLVIFG